MAVELPAKPPFTMSLAASSVFLSGRNMDAWVDLMTYLDEEDGTRSVTVLPGEFLTIQIDHYADLKARCPEIIEDLVEAVAFVNWRRIEQGQSAILALSFSK